MDDVEMAAAEQPAEPGEPAEIGRSRHAKAMRGDTDALELGRELLLPVEEVRHLEVERAAVMDFCGGDEQALGSPRTEPFDEPQDPQPAHCWQRNQGALPKSGRSLVAGTLLAPCAESQVSSTRRGPRPVTSSVRLRRRWPTPCS